MHFVLFALDYTTSYFGDSSTMAGKVTTDMMKSFNGTGDVVSWLKKAKLVAKLQGVKDLATFVPLFLEGDALALYLQLSEEEQSKIAIIEKKLLEAFTDGPFVAYGKLVKKRWEGEQVDVFANEIRRLGGLAGFEGVGLDRLVTLTFVNGFPDSISCELQQLAGIFEMEMSDIISRARVLTANKSAMGTMIAAAAHGDRYQGQGQGASQQYNREDTRSFRGMCYRCGGPHMAKFCKTKPRGEIVCYRCNKPGHVAAQCNQGNEYRVTGAPAAIHHQ